MPTPEHLQTRPRSTAEVLDDGWRLALADAPLLLALSGLFFLPAASLILWLLTQPPAATWLQLTLTAAAAGSLLLTGVSAGACQEAFHLRSEGREPALAGCLAAALRRGLGHATAQALALALPACAVFWLTLPGASPVVRVLLALAVLALFLPVWMLGLTRHAALTAGQLGPWRSWRGAAQISGRHPARALAVVFARLALLLMAVLNIHLFVHFGLWAAQDLAGLDVALASALCGLGNPPYLLGVFVLAWWLLSPYAEAVNYLFFVDARVRHEGLDLWYRVEDLFPVSDRSQPAPPPAGAALLALAALLAMPGAAPADSLGSVREARRGVAAARTELERGGDPARAVEPLRRAAAKRDGLSWYHKEVERLPQRDRKAAAETLERIDRRLAAAEDSLIRRGGHDGPTPEQVKALVSPEARARTTPERPDEDRDRKERDEKPPERDRRGDDFFKGRRAGDGGLVAGASLAGAANVLLYLFLAVGAGVLALVLALVVREWLRNRRPKPALQRGPAAQDEREAAPDRPDLENPDAMWRQADDLARSGNFLAAVRAVYLAVLGLLHTGGLIRYERTRTNGEYADALRRRRDLHGPFCRLTGLFELKWYGERSCRADDYHDCRELAQELRRAAEAPAPA